MVTAGNSVLKKSIHISYNVVPQIFLQSYEHIYFMSWPQLGFPNVNIKIQVGRMMGNTELSIQTWTFFFFLETGSHYVALDGLKLAMYAIVVLNS